MKKLFMVILMLILAVGIFANPAILTNGNAEQQIENDLLMVDMDTVFEALQPYVEAWGSYTYITVHICQDCEGKVNVAWGSKEEGLLHYMKMVYFDGEWITIEASEFLEVLGIDPASSS